MNRGRVVGWVIPALLVVGTVMVALLLVSDDDAEAPAPEPVEASGPVYSTVEEMAAAADLVVEGTVVAVEEGRAITAPDDPDRGVVTQLVQVDTSDGRSIVVEQEATLLDGTPIVVNGLPPAATGDDGFWFLVLGGSDEFPYTALINEQARVIVDADVPRTVVGDEILDAELEEIGVVGLRQLLR